MHFDTSLLLELAQKFSVVTYSIVIAVGVTQGVVLGQAVIERFPRLQFHTRFASLLFFLLFMTYAIVSVVRFANPDKIDVSQIFASSTTTSEVLSIILRVIGLNIDMGAIITFSITAFVLVIWKLTGLKGWRGSFVLVISMVMLVIMSVLKFSDYQPGSFEILLFTLYHAGLTGGVLWGTRRRLYSKELRVRNFINWWAGKTES